VLLTFVVRFLIKNLSEALLVLLKLKLTRISGFTIRIALGSSNFILKFEAEAMPDV
jgi:hypothetical protein